MIRLGPLVLSISRLSAAGAGMALLLWVGDAVGVGATTGSWSPTASMLTPRILHTATLLADGRVLVAGGVTPGPSTTATAELFDPAGGTRSAAANMHTARSRHVAVLLRDGMVLVAGGRQANGVATSSAEMYDASTNAWMPAASMGVARDNFTATLLFDGRVLVAGGTGGSGIGVGVEKSVEIYDPVLDRWQLVAPMANRRYGYAAVGLTDGRVLIAGGAGPAGDCALMRTVEIFSPTTGQWEAADPMTTARAFMSLERLPDGTTLVSGGQTMPADCVSGFSAAATAERYDARLDRWSATGTMATGRRVFGFAQLIDGRVLVAGGRSADGNALSSAELYDPASGAWKSAGFLTAARAGVVLTTLVDGSVLATGGGNPVPVSVADLYTSPDASGQ